MKKEGIFYTIVYSTLHLGKAIRPRIALEI